MLITIIGDVEDCEKEFIERINQAIANEEKIEIAIDSYGGDLYSALAIATSIRIASTREDVEPPSCFVLGRCSSAALMIFAACEERVVASHAQMYWHPMRANNGECDALENRQWSDHYEKLEHQSRVKLAQWLGTTHGKIVDLEENRTIMTAEMVEREGWASII